MKNNKLVPLVLIVVLIVGLAIVKLGCGAATSTDPTTTTTAPATTTTTPGTTTTTAAGSFSLTSSAFTAGGAIPINNAKASQGTGANNQSVPLSWANAPAGTQYFALVMLDTDNSNSVHWMVVNIPAATTSLAENASVSGMPAGSTEIANDFTTGQYEGPWPPTGDTHSYQFMIYALDSSVTASSITDLATFNTAVSSNLGTATLTGTFTGR